MTLLFCLLAVILIFIICGTSGVGSDEVSVPVKEGDSVTFHTGVKTSQQEVIKWYFKNSLIAEIYGDLSKICTDVQCNEDTERFRDRLKLDHQTGSLTIMNTRTTDSGLYDLRSISSISSTDKTFSVTVSGVSADEVKTISVKEGESVTLDPDDAKTTSDVITWFFNGTCITKITGDPNQISTDLQTNERFKDRLTVNQNGSLTMMNTRIIDSGLYRLQIISSSDGISITRMKIFSVSVIAVPDSGLSSGAAAGTVVVLVSVAVLLVAAVVAVAVIYHRRRRHTAVPQDDKDNISPVDLKDMSLEEGDKSLNR